jgi:hypothetical protein
MTEPTKIDFRYRRISQIADITDIVAILFPGNRNQQHAAARILLALKEAGGLVPSLTFLEDKHGISRRTLQRTRAKLSRLGLIEHVTWMNSRYGGQSGWKLSGRYASVLRRLAEKFDKWRSDKRVERREKEETLAALLR